MHCIIHVKESTEDIKKCTQVSYAKILEHAKKWRTLDSVQQYVALELDLNASLSDEFGYHGDRYRNFTNTRNIQQAENRVSRGKRRPYHTEAIAEVNEQAGNAPTPTCSRVLRSDDIETRSRSTNTPQPRSAHILPPVCIICVKPKRKRERHSLRKITERLVDCETDSTTLIKAAKHPDNSSTPEAERILLQISDRDPVSLEVKYHRSCYTKFTKCLYPRDEQSKSLSESFDLFCKNVIEGRIIGNSEVLRLTKLRDLFIATVAEEENVCIDGYRSYQLKKRLKKKFPELTFIRQSVTSSELVLYNDASSSVCVDLDGIDSSSDSNSDSSGDCDSVRKVKDQHGQSKTRDLFVAAQSLKRDVLDCHHIKSWPPTSEDISLANVSHIVPPSLFNFIAWCCNKSDDVSNAERVSVSDETMRKIYSISQDIIHLASGGKKLMPKHVALSMTIRHEWLQYIN